MISMGSCRFAAWDANKGLDLGNAKALGVRTGMIVDLTYPAERVVFVPGYQVVCGYDSERVCASEYGSLGL